MQQNHHEKQKTTKSLIIGSLKRSQKKKLKKQNTFNPDHSVESPKLMKVRKNSTHSIASCPAVVSTEEWTVIDSDSDIEYKGGFHVLMSCFTLGGSYRQKKKKIAATFTENEIYIPCEKRIDTPEKCENSNSIINMCTNQKETEKSIIISDSIVNPKAITCCTSPKQSLENVALKNSVRCIKRKKRKAPLPPNLSNSSEQICPLNNSKEFSKIDDLPTTIGKLYTFNKAPVNHQQSTQVVSSAIQKTELSVICQGKYARVLEEKKFSDLSDYDKRITPKKRKSPKKKPAPKPPVIPTNNSCIAINLSNNLDEIVNFKGKQPNEYSESSLLRNTVNNNNLCICNCASYKQHTFNYINIPHFVCPDLEKDAEAYNVTVLGYFSIGRKNENSKEEIKFHKNGFQSFCQNESEECFFDNSNINQKHKQFIVPLNQRRKCNCNYPRQIESMQNNFEEKQFNEYSKEKFNLCANHHKFNNSVLMCSCSNSHSIVNENELSKDDKYVSDDHRKRMFAKNQKQNPSAIDCAFNNSKSKSSLKLNESEPFIGLEELIKSRPSVSDFIAAFNYLTQRNSDLDLTNIKISSENNYKKLDKIEEFALDDNDYDLKSLPTKWKYAPMDFHINKVKAMKLEKMHKNIKPLKSCLINKNNKVTFENETKSNESNKLNSKESKIDIIPKVPYNYYVAAHKHARNQEYFNQKDRVKKNSFNKYDPETTKAYPDRKIIMNPNYRKSYRAPPIPDSKNYQKLHLSGQIRKKHSLEKIDEYEMMPKKYAGKIWVSLYIEDKSSHKGLIPLLISPTMTLGMLKEKLERQLGYPKNLQRWILGKSFATDDNSTLAEYNVVEEGCPVFLYMTEKNPCNDYENFIYDQNNKVDDTIIEESESDSDISIDSDSGTVILASDTDMLSESSESSGSKSIDYERKEMYSKGALLKTEVHLENKKSQRDIPQKLDMAKENYKLWMEIEDQDLIKNLESFDCPICFSTVNVGDGVMLKECLHLFCKECLSDTVLYSEEAIIKCPFKNDEYSCNSFLQEREIKALVSPEVFERHLQRSIAAAESQAKNSFHCKTPDCPGWCLYEDKVNLFLCPVCSHLNCLTCQVIHEGRNCRQYQDELDFISMTSDEAKKTKDYLDKMLKEGEAMRCPQCHIILMKKWGCDWLKCSVCLTEICWVTKGYRWGPRGRGDTSSGCKCGVNGIRCHPKCKYCH